jgi:hypothetical protein
MDLLESVGENFDVNFVMKEFPADKQFVIWWINLEQRDSLIDKKTKHKPWVLTEKLDSTGTRSNPRMEELKENNRREISNITADNLWEVNQNLFCWCEECLRVEGQHFQHLLWYVNKNKNFPSFQMLLTCWVINKIHVSLAASDVPIAVKCRAMNAWTSLKSSLYYCFSLLATRLRFWVHVCLLAWKTEI